MKKASKGAVASHTFTISFSPQKLVRAIPAEPRTIPIPEPSEVCPWSGLRRGKVNTLILPNLNDGKPPVKSIVLPNRGKNKRGVRLVVWTEPGGLKEYLEKLDREQNPEAA